MTSDVRRPGPVVVLVFSHADPPQVRRLIDRLRTGDDVFVAVHHDPRGEPLALSTPSTLSNVGIVPDPMHVPWGRFEMSLAMVTSLQWVAKTVPDLSWVLFISGQDYPAMPMRRLEQELRTSPHDAFLRHFRIDDDPALDVHPWQALTRRRYFGRRRFPHSVRAYPWPRRHPFVDGRHAYVGDVWYNLGAEAVQHVLGDAAWTRTLLRFLGPSPNPDEMVIPSLVLNGQDHLDVVNDRRRYLRFPPGGHHPVTLTVDQVPEIVTSGAFFARKVGSSTPGVLEALDAAISG